MCRSEQPLATVIDGYTLTQREKRSVRLTRQAEVSASSVFLMKKLLHNLKPQVEDHFSLTLSGCEIPQFLVYQPGDFFLPHTDGGDEPDKPDYFRKRRLSAVIFLSDETGEPQPEGYCGGKLTFYGLIDDARWERYGFPLTGKKGLLVVFRSEVLHEVTAITHGTRYSIVSWFF